jgi:hypothetical protein
MAMVPASPPLGKVESPEEGQMGLAPFARFTEAAHDHHGNH